MLGPRLGFYQLIFVLVLAAIVGCGGDPNEIQVAEGGDDVTFHPKGMIATNPDIDGVPMLRISGRMKNDEKSAEFIRRICREWKGPIVIDATSTSILPLTAKAISECECVETIELFQADFWEGGFQFPFKSTKLKNLSIADSNMDDESFAKMGLPGSLRKLHLFMVINLTSKSARVIGDHGELAELSSVHFDDEAIPQIVRCKNLQILRIGTPTITDHSVPLLATLTKCRELKLSYSKITDASIDELLKMPALEVLDISNTKISLAGAVRLRQKIKTVVGRTSEWSYD